MIYFSEILKIGDFKAADNPHKLAWTWSDKIEDLFPRGHDGEPFPYFHKPMTPPVTFEQPFPVTISWNAFPRRITAYAEALGGSRSEVRNRAFEVAETPEPIVYQLRRRTTSEEAALFQHRYVPGSTMPMLLESGEIVFFRKSMQPPRLRLVQSPATCH